MDNTNRHRPQVFGGVSASAGGDGHRSGAGARGAKNPRARLITRQTTTANSLKDTDLLNVMTYNVRTLMAEDRLIEIENALNDISWDIIGLAEVRRLGEETLERENLIFYHYGATQGMLGVGFLVAKKWKDNIIEFNGHSDRIASLKFRLTATKTLTVIQAHAPTASKSNDAEVEVFYDHLNKICDENRSTWTMVVGDFNAKVGIRQNSDSDVVIGKHGLGSRNERGKRLIQFAFGQGLKIANSFFLKKAQRRWTWKGPNEITKNEIDFILSPNMHMINDVGVINRIKFNSDHRPLRAKVRFDFKIQRAMLFKSRFQKVTRQTLVNNTDQFNLELSNYFSALQVEESEYEKNVDIQYDNIIDAIHTSCKKIKRDKPNKKKLSNHTIQLIEDRMQFEIGTQERRKIDKQVKRSIRNDIRNYNTFQVKVALENNSSLRAAKKGCFKGKTWINRLQDNSGVKHGNRQKLLEICSEFYKSLYSDPNKIKQSINFSRSDNIPYISGFEVHSALKTMKYDRSPGEDGITTEALKTGSKILLPHITNLLNTMLHTGNIPKQMCHSNIILIHKKGDKSVINNYRPISLVSHLYKVFIKVIEKRISCKLDRHQPPEQAGFRPGFSTTDHLHTINQIIEKHNEFNKPLYLAFVDYKKAFDSIIHESIYTALENQEIDKTYIDLIKTIYNNSTADIKLNSSGPKFPIEKGVKQGDPLSPKLFTSTLEEVFKSIASSWQTKGIDVGNRKLNNLRFADDIVLFAKTAPELEEMLQELSTASSRVGLTMNRSKTQVMTNSTKRRVEVDGQEIHYVDEYVYLGQLVSFMNRQDREVERRVESAWRSFWSMKELMKGDLPISLKRKLIDMCILPVLTYGAQTWSLTEDQKSKLGVCQRAMERSILGIKRTDRVKNTTLRSITGVVDVGQKAAKLKWDWAGHVMRMHPDRWARIVTLWEPDGRRSRGRPRNRWRNDLDAFERNWRETTEDRDTWKEMGETFAQQWDSIG